MYFAKGIRDLLQVTQLSLEFFEGLDEFQIQFIEMCFKQSIDEKMGLMSAVEKYNYDLFEEYKIRQFESTYGLDEEYLKSVA